MGDYEASEYPPLIISFILEVFGTAVLMFLGCMGCILDFGTGPIIPAFTFGLTILAIVQAFHHFGPVHINPAVSIAMLIMGKMNIWYFLVYIVAQYIGATLGYGLLSLVTPYQQDMCLLRTKLGTSAIQCFVNEMGGSFCLILLVLGAVDEKNTDFKDSIAVRIGLGLTGIIFALEPFSGAGLNPARSFPPVIFHMNFKDHWVYELGPTAGMVLGAVVYRFVIDDMEPYSLHSFLLSRRNAV